jgi:hypothetical protein
MVIYISAQLEAALNEEAQKQGTDGETLAHRVLSERFIRKPPFEPQDEWERRLLEIGTDCGVSLSNEALSSEGIYE